MYLAGFQTQKLKIVHCVLKNLLYFFVNVTVGNHGNVVLCNSVEVVGSLCVPSVNQYAKKWMKIHHENQS